MSRCHQHPRNYLVAGAYQNHAVKFVRFHHDFYRSCYYVPARKRVSHALMSHRYAIANCNRIKLKWCAPRRSYSVLDSPRHFVKMHMPRYDIGPAVNHRHQWPIDFFVGKAACLQQGSCHVAFNSAVYFSTSQFRRHKAKHL